jgi:hypothetical protein
MTSLDEQNRPEPPVAGDETATLLGSLERQRATLAWKCGGLDAAGLRARLEPSAITLGGLLKHLALVEDEYFTRRLLGRELGPPWDTVDWDADRDWDWHSAAEDTPEQLMSLWQDAVARSRATITEALVDGGLDQLAQHSWPDGRSPSLRRILIDLIEETRGTSAMPTSSGSRWMGSSGRIRRADGAPSSPGSRAHAYRVTSSVTVRLTTRTPDAAPGRM